MAELNLPKFVQLTLDEAVPAPVAERLARTSYSPDELVARRKRLRRVFGSVLLGAGGLILIAGLVAAIRGGRDSGPVAHPAPVVLEPSTPTAGDVQPAQAMTLESSVDTSPLSDTSLVGTAPPASPPKAATPAPAHKSGIKAKKAPAAIAPHTL